MRSDERIPNVSESNEKEAPVAPGEAVLRKWQLRFRNGLAGAADQQSTTKPQFEKIPPPSSSSTHKSLEATPGGDAMPQNNSSPISP